MKTQIDFVKEKLNKDGFISNLYGINHYILRMGARIWQLRQQGMNIKGGYEVKKGKLTKNYVYRLVK